MKQQHNTQEALKISKEPVALKIISSLLGLIALSIGLINIFWGNDGGFGIFIILLSSIYFIPLNTISKKLFSFSIPRFGLLKILLTLFILWAALGVGELSNKIGMMLN
ncbi:hypothetical protein JKA74_09490 [Marivirga sp. S37H4]|uniref:Uncharacterized protein n=1 Tax=Marivirga aurantiaca TaxID=2802615 RepID=A0A935C8Z3_9BACT|nr:hypothetical protein [Marivirga aurantiaca]MBK6265272.1 hypothetical protein [Marivirga aurantiaca]